MIILAQEATRHNCSYQDWRERIVGTTKTAPEKELRELYAAGENVESAAQSLAEGGFLLSKRDARKRRYRSVMSKARCDQFFASALIDTASKLLRRPLEPATRKHVQDIMDQASRALAAAPDEPDTDLMQPDL